MEHYKLVDPFCLFYLHFITHGKTKDPEFNMCELKYYSKPYKVNKSDYDKIIKREELLASMIAPREVVHSTLITTYEPERNEYSGVFSKVITLDDLFA